MIKESVKYKEFNNNSTQIQSNSSEYISDSENIYNLPNSTNFNNHECNNRKIMLDLHEKLQNNCIVSSDPKYKFKCKEFKVNILQDELKCLKLNEKIRNDLKKLDSLRSEGVKLENKNSKEKNCYNRIKIRRPFENMIQTKRVKKRKPIEFSSSLFGNLNS